MSDLDAERGHCPGETAPFLSHSLEEDDLLGVVEEVASLEDELAFVPRIPGIRMALTGCGRSWVAEALAQVYGVRERRHGPRWSTSWLHVVPRGPQR